MSLLNAFNSFLRIHLCVTPEVEIKMKISLLTFQTNLLQHKRPEQLFSPQSCLSGHNAAKHIAAFQLFPSHHRQNHYRHEVKETIPAWSRTGSGVIVALKGKTLQHF